MPDGKTISMNLAFIGDVKSGNIRDMNAASSWSIVSFDEDGSNEKQLHPAGSGHPVGLPHNGQRYLVTDVYGKEQKFFHGLKISNQLKCKFVQHQCQHTFRPTKSDGRCVFLCVSTRASCGHGGGG